MYYPSLFNGDFASDLFDEVLNFPVDYGKRLRNEMLDKKRWLKLWVQPNNTSKRLLIH